MNLKFCFPFLSVRHDPVPKFIPCSEVRNFMSKRYKKHVFVQIMINGYLMRFAVMRMPVITELA